MCEIAYQNKDITSKLFAERFQGKVTESIWSEPATGQTGVTDEYPADYGKRTED